MDQSLEEAVGAATFNEILDIHGKQIVCEIFLFLLLVLWFSTHFSAIRFMKYAKLKHIYVFCGAVVTMLALSTELSSTGHG